MDYKPEDYSQSYKDRKNFNDWFVNVFWFQYKWVVFAIAVVVVALGFLVIDAIRQPHYDTSVVIAARNTIDENDIGELDDLLCSVVPDVDGNGKVQIEYVILYMGEGDLGVSNQERIWLCFTDSTYALYLMDEECSDLYCEPSLEYFDPLENYGIEADEDNSCRVSMEDNALMKRLGLGGLYGSIMDHGSVTQDETDIQTADIAQDMLKAILAAD